MAPTSAGLIVGAVRIGGGTEEPRVNGKLVRWGKLQVSELSVEASAGLRIVAVQVEGQVLKGVDDEADRICEFVRDLLAAIDGRAAWQTSGPITVQAMPQAAVAPRAKAPAPTAARKPAAKPLPRAVSATRVSKPKAEIAASSAQAGPKPPAAAQPPAKAPGGKPAKAPGGKAIPAWVPPHPIGLPAGPAVRPSALVRTQPLAGPKTAVARPPLQPTASAATARPTEAPPDEVGTEWEVPAPGESAARDKKRTRTWTP
jgi:hypothetical protein